MLKHRDTREGEGGGFVLFCLICAIVCVIIVISERRGAELVKSEPRVKIIVVAPVRIEYEGVINEMGHTTAWVEITSKDGQRVMISAPYIIEYPLPPAKLESDLPW